MLADYQKINSKQPLILSDNSCETVINVTREQILNST